MFIKKEKNLIHFKYLDKAYAIIEIDEANSQITLNILKVSEPFRNMGIATFVLKEILNYITTFFKSVKNIVLSPLPLDTKGLNLEQLINFYKKFGFNFSKIKDRSTPYLMCKYIQI